MPNKSQADWDNIPKTNARNQGPISAQLAEASARIDALSLCANESADRFIRLNLFQYYVLENTWYLLIEELIGFPPTEFLAKLQTGGLIALIRQAQELSNAIINDQEWPTNVFSYYCKLCNSSLEDIRVVLQVLRYPKRFCPLGADALDQQAIDGFLMRNNRARQLDRRGIPHWLEKSLREIILSILGTNDRRISNRYDPDMRLPGGTTAEGSKTLVEKAKDIQWDYPLFFYPYNSALKNYNNSSDYCLIRAVPKTYKGPRIIAEENTIRQTQMSLYEDDMRYAIDHAKSTMGTAGRVLLRDQQRNRELARIASVDGSLATADATAASDSVTAAFVRSIFPPTYVRDWDALRSTYFEYIDSKGVPHRKTLYLYATMGSRLTFPIESLAFWAIACEAVYQSSLFLGINPDYSQISDYGDDVIIPSYAYETFRDFAEMCGFIINDEKSYWTGHYRESCGEEYLDGYNLSSKYFPRKPLQANAIGVQRLVELQHKLYSHRKVKAFLDSVVLALYPKMTYSPVGSSYDDLWSEFEPPLTRDMGRYSISNGKAKRIGDSGYEYEIHTTLTTKYGDNLPPIHERHFDDTYDLANRIAYLDFLAHGPRYDDPFLESLGISSKPVSLDAYLFEGTSILKNKKY
jgi:hypothetical protein